MNQSNSKKHETAKKTEDATDVTVTHSDSSKNEKLTSDAKEDEAVIAKFDLTGVDPSNVTIRCNDERRVITVTVARIVRTLFGPIRSTSQRHVAIPDGVDPQKLRSYFDAKGQLVIVAKHGVTQQEMTSEVSETTGQSTVAANEDESENNESAAEAMDEKREADDDAHAPAYEESMDEQQVEDDVQNDIDHDIEQGVDHDVEQGVDHDVE